MPKYEFQNTIVAFVDILGFSKIIKDNHWNSPIVQNVLTTLDTLQTLEGDSSLKISENSPDSLEVEYRPNIKCFSDSIVFCGIDDNRFPKCESSSLSQAIQAIAYSISKLQINLLADGFASRGAIAIGEMYINGNLIAGLPYIQAYEAEKTEACYPRVIFTESMIKPETKTDFSFRPTLKKEDTVDGKIFINYIGDFIRNAKYSDSLLPKLQKIRGVIVKNMNSEHADERIKEKWSWIANQFNTALKDYKREDCKAPIYTPSIK